VDEQEAAQSVYECLLAFGQQASNPVLAVIAGHDTLQSGRHYPEPYLSFAEQRLRAYYHSHSHPQQQEDEHGHFHLFANTGIGQACWTHLAALSMDEQGQVKRWLSTNRWVTDECWQEAQMLTAFSLPPLEEESPLLERWLYSMVSLYRQELMALWRRRDQRLTEIKANSAETDILQNTDHYILAEGDIALLEKIQKVLQL